MEFGSVPLAWPLKYNSMALAFAKSNQLVLSTCSVPDGVQGLGTEVWNPQAWPEGAGAVTGDTKERPSAYLG